MPNIHNLAGQKFGLLTAKECSDNNLTRHGKMVRKWLCVCDCGREIRVVAASLKNGNTRSCGCMKLSPKRKPARPGKTMDNIRSKEYEAWIGIRQRCLNPNNKSYKNYGGRGISVCNRWDDFYAFLSDVGAAPSPKHSIDRIDNSLGYSPENCQWSTSLEQARNRRSTKFFTKDGVTKNMKEWCAYFGVSRESFRYYLKMGHDFDYIHASFSRRALKVLGRLPLIPSALE